MTLQFNDNGELKKIKIVMEVNNKTSRKFLRQRGYH